MRFQRKTSFRPAVESIESRILATADLSVASQHPSEVQASSATEAQAWVKIVNPTVQTLVFQLSANGGSTYHTYRLSQHSSGFYHVDRADPSFLLVTGGATPTSLTTGTTRSNAPAYSLHASISIVPGPGPGGVATALPYTANFSIINQTSKQMGAGGFAVKIDFSVDGGKTYTVSKTIDYTDGRTKQPVTFHYGDLGILYKIPANATLRPTPLTSLMSYYLFVNTSFQPYLSPTS